MKYFKINIHVSFQSLLMCDNGDDDCPNEEEFLIEFLMEKASELSIDVWLCVPALLDDLELEIASTVLSVLRMLSPIILSEPDFEFCTKMSSKDKPGAVQNSCSWIAVFWNIKVKWKYIKDHDIEKVSVLNKDHTRK